MIGDGQMEGGGRLMDWWVIIMAHTCIHIHAHTHAHTYTRMPTHTYIYVIIISPSMRMKGPVYMQKMLVVRVRDMGHDCRAGVKDGKDGDEDDQVDVWCFPERKTTQH